MHESQSHDAKCLRWAGTSPSVAGVRSAVPSYKTRIVCAADVRDKRCGVPCVVLRIQLEKVLRADDERPSGRRFGALVHAMHAAVDLDASSDEIGAVTQANARLIDATAGEIDATVSQHARSRRI
jgi:hypothetical protein